MKYTHLRKVTLAMLAALTVMVLAAGAAFAGSGEEKAKISLTGIGAPGASGEAELRRDPAKQEFEFQAKVEGLMSDQIVSFCFNMTLIDTEDADDKGRVELNEDQVDGDPVVVFPGSIFGGVVTIWAGNSCGGDELLRGSVP